MNRGLFRWASGLGVLLIAGSIQAGKPAAPVDRWTARTPDEMLDLALRRAERGGDGAMAGLALAYSLADRASAGRARKGLLDLGRPDDDIAAQARWLAAELDPNPAASVPGLVRGWAALGPFQDTGGGLTRHEGPETAGEEWGNPKASYAWGAYEVRWREVPREVVSARGVPLDLMVHPRKESCSYLATKVTVRDKAPVVLSVASSGSVRLLWDGADAGKSEEDHLGLVFDRIAAKIEPTVGDHVLGVKVCSGAPNDEGRVRVRAADAVGQTGGAYDLVRHSRQGGTGQADHRSGDDALGSRRRGRKESAGREGDGRQRWSERSASPTISVPRARLGFSTRSPTPRPRAPTRWPWRAGFRRSARLEADGSTSRSIARSLLRMRPPRASPSGG